ncbi:LapA family protein [Bradyrhizobium sp.]|uniref:LapA family protein n=1 Tax=Bradyrhizobium sp. TaxID=376 RepID=UPI004037D9EB
MRKFLTALVVIPLGVFFVIFAVANRHLVTVSFDPFNSVTPTVAVTLPLFVVIIAFTMLGVLAGGMATWFRQGRWRRSARQHEAEARQMRAQLADLRTQNAREQRYPALPQGGIYGSAGRDKQSATL